MSTITTPRPITDDERYMFQEHGYEISRKVGNATVVMNFDKFGEVGIESTVEGGDSIPTFHHWSPGRPENWGADIAVFWRVVESIMANEFDKH